MKTGYASELHINPDPNPDSGDSNFLDPDPDPTGSRPGSGPESGRTRWSLQMTA